jgi:hypothetical protein
MILQTLETIKFKNKLMRKLENLLQSIIDNMFKFAEIDMSYNKLIDNGVTKTDMMWMDQYEMTETQHKMWKDHSIKAIKKYLKCTQRKADAEFAWLDLMYGIKVKKETTSVDFDDLA